jgi:DNA-binding SARP family transcriptional activator
MLHVGPEDVELKSGGSLWLDVETFEQAFAEAEGVKGRDLDPAQVDALDEAARLYRGDLLEGCYQDWCLFERERLQNMYFALLDKLMGYCEAHAQYDVGLAYGAQILRLDRARERAHRRMMRLYFLEGDRTAALRQYERCVKALEEELGVKPDRRTQQLYHHIRVNLPTTPTSTPGDEAQPPLVEALGHLEQLSAALVGLQQQVELRIQTIEQLVQRTR